MKKRSRFAASMIVLGIPMSFLRVTAQPSDYVKHLVATYDTYSVAALNTPRFRHADLLAVLEQLKGPLGGIMTVATAGASVEGRSISLLILGTGEKNVLMWSQMHGDEPTATMALLDLLSYVASQKESPQVKTILSKTTLLLVPMLNPDGAERFQRRNAQGIDINRDALRLQTPEGRLLKEIRDRYQPEFGFNLHDQDPRGTVGTTGKVATISLLAPAFDPSRSDNPVRQRAKKVAAELISVLTPIIEGHVSRYDDSFEPRAFGDNIQKWGTSTVLIESGGWKDDPEKMFIRKVNCVALAAILHSIATGEYEKADTSLYSGLPESGKPACDLKIRNLRIQYANGQSPVIADVAINRDPNGNAGKGRVVDFGDLTGVAAFEVIDAAGASVSADQVTLESVVDVEKLLLAVKR